MVTRFYWARGMIRGLIESLLAETSFRVIVVDSRPEKVRELRKEKWTNSATG